MKTRVGTQNKDLDVCASVSRKVSNTAYSYPKTLQCNVMLVDGVCGIHWNL